ncbi:hypothetical protein OOT46_03420 [Aquabacterium sp. A7-Y]|uniref:hypothetical protein n=1 Tax=Aquabacterium sp. A7-Y TaxID=1349605 RepID=UPI00223DDA4B|nr:hypothetical protein [Aquabacterium sp. A7-Y]MCW7536903.1 hypothetical protein [Aquabacterium sp. A7-Y]
MPPLNGAAGAAASLGVASVLALTLAGLDDSGRCSAWGCLLAGLAAGAAAWWRTGMATRDLPWTLLPRAPAAVMTGTAVYLNLLALLWHFGAPLSLGPLSEDGVRQLYWLAPLNLLAAAACFACWRIDADEAAAPHPHERR